MRPTLEVLANAKGCQFLNTSALGQVTTPCQSTPRDFSTSINSSQRQLAPFATRSTPPLDNSFDRASLLGVGLITSIQLVVLRPRGFKKMLLPKGGVNWKGASSRLPPTRAIWVFLTRTRFLLSVALAGIVILLWRGVSTSAGEMQR